MSEELRAIEDVIDFGKGRLTSCTDQQAVWYGARSNGEHYTKIEFIIPDNDTK